MLVRRGQHGLHEGEGRGDFLGTECTSCPRGLGSTVISKSHNSPGRQGLLAPFCRWRDQGWRTTSLSNAFQ